MTSALRLTLDVWRSTRRRDPGERAFLVYAAVLVALVTVVPVVRGVWLAATAPQAVAALAPAAVAPPLVVVAVGVCGVAAVLAGRVQGPVTMAPFLAFALTRGPSSRAAVAARPIARAVAACAAAGALAAAVPVLAWSAGGSVGVLGAVAFVLAGAACGASLAMLWAVGQAVSSRTAAVLVAALAAMTAATAALPAGLALTPPGWIALAYATAGSSPAAVAVVALALLGAAGLPAVLRRLDADVVLAHSLRWDAASAHAGVLDLAAVADAFLPLPRSARRVGAVRNVRALLLRLMARDAVAALRTPGRLAAGVVALLAAGGALAAAVAAPWGTSLLLGAVAGLLAYAGAGPLTDGIRHLVEATSSIAVYGASDSWMLAGHALFPVATAALLVGVTVVVGVPWGGTAVPAAIAAVAVAVGAVGTRLIGALKPPMPIVLLAPIPTPMGDLSAAVRVAWAMDVALLAAAIGAAAAVVAQAPMLLVAALGLAGATALRRWTRR